MGHGPENKEKTPLKTKFLLIINEKCDINDAKMNTNHSPTLIYLLIPEQNKKRRKPKLEMLLHHFHRWRDCTERVQQAFKPLGFP